jgi:raffinose/stachyose/melibiose transport system permease protein
MDNGTSPANLTATFAFNLTVLNVNDPPELTGFEAELTSVQGEPYRFNVSADDPDFLTIYGEALGFGINMILFLAGLQSIPQELYECARIDGATGAQQFFGITIPMLGKMLQIIVMLALISTLKTFELFQVLTNGGPFHATEVMMLYVYKKFFGTGEGAGAVLAPQIGYASAIGFVVALIVAAVTAFYMFLSRRLDREA